MREILFRGKRADNGEWVEGYYYLIPETYGFFTQEVHAITTVYCNNDFDVIPETVGQYTGLKDKNGKMIFEGDIVRYGETVHKVVFEQRNGTAYFGLVYSPLETLPFGHYQDLKQIEVIGNIHDNPELLENGGEPK